MSKVQSGLTVLKQERVKGFICLQNSLRSKVPKITLVFLSQGHQPKYALLTDKNNANQSSSITNLFGPFHNSFNRYLVESIISYFKGIKFLSLS